MHFVSLALRTECVFAHSRAGLVGLTIQGEASRSILELAYDVLGLEALFLVPRIFALLSLNPYFGTLVRSVRAEAPICGFTDQVTDPVSQGDG